MWELREINGELWYIEFEGTRANPGPVTKEIFVGSDGWDCMKEIGESVGNCIGLLVRTHIHYARNDPDGSFFDEKGFYEQAKVFQQGWNRDG